MATRYAVVELESTDSTQEEARERRATQHTVLVVADRQTAGRGRSGRRWVQADRAMFSSLAFEPTWPIDRWSLIPLAAGLAVRSAIDDLAGVDAGLRWPNDLMIGDAKLGGILAESDERAVVIGCGVNLEWASPMTGAVALDAATTRSVTGADLAVAWADRFLDRMARSSDDWGLDEYRSACRTIGRAVSYPRGSGVAVGVGDDGSLLVETSVGVVNVHSGEVRLHDAATLPTDRRD